MVQLYRIGDYPEHSAQMPVEPDAAGLDLFIGEKDHVHRGLGPHILRRFLDELVFPEYAACAIDPAERNRSAIRAYKKAGFRYVATIIDRETGERESIMRADRPAMKAVSD
jgi:RimJ/RimL family protein N-acetyltransferase